MQRLPSQKAVWQTAILRSALICLADHESSKGSAGMIKWTPCCLSTSAKARGPESDGPSPKKEPPLTLGKGERVLSHKTYPAQPPGSSAVGSTEPEPDPFQDKSIGLFQRFKKTFKQYGKVMIPVHLLTSSFWFGSFYYGAMKGINVVPFLEYAGFPDKIVNVLRDSQSGYALTAYAMYKIATPVRYTVTLTGTSLSVKYLRKYGYLSTPPPVRDYLQDKMEETREKFSEKMEETKEKLTEKMEETKELFSEKMEETKELFSEKMEETKERLSEKMEETKERLSEKMEETKERLSGRVEDKIPEKLEGTKDKMSFRKKI